MHISTPKTIRALACDYDGTIANGGVLEPSTIAALEKFRASGRRTILVSGRRLDHLSTVFTRFDLFDCLVLENGGLLYWPKSRREVTLSAPPPPGLLEFLAKRGATPLVHGRVIVATEQPFESDMAEAIKTLRIDWHIILNKGAVMALPRGVDKASGLGAAVDHLGIPLGEVIGVGDAENDLTFLRVCGGSAAVANALPDVKKEVDVVTPSASGKGTEELIEAILSGK